MIYFLNISKELKPKTFVFHLYHSKDIEINFLFLVFFKIFLPPSNAVSSQSHPNFMFSWLCYSVYCHCDLCIINKLMIFFTSSSFKWKFILFCFYVFYLSSYIQNFLKIMMKMRVLKAFNVI